MAFLDYDGLRRLVAIMDERYTRNRTKDSWLTVQKNVRLGRGETLYPVGSQLTLKHSVYGDIVMDVVSHDTVKKYGDESAHTMTLMAHNCLAKFQYDAPEAMYYAAAELGAGIYNFTVGAAYTKWAAGTYQFTLTQAVPVGGQLCISGNANTALTSLKVQSFASASSTNVIESAAITSGSEGAALGTLGTELNHPQRMSYGSNNYKESAIRQLLNSEAAAGSLWTPQTYFDRPPAWAEGTAGFLNGCSEDFLNAIATAVVKCSANNTYECPASMGGSVTKNTAYELTDKIFLASAAEVGLNGGDVADDSTLYEFFEGASNTDRIKYLNDSAQYWWTRTPVTWGADGVRRVNISGSLNYNSAYGVCGLVPACIIA